MAPLEDNCRQRTICLSLVLSPLKPRSKMKSKRIGEEGKTNPNAP
jgi:hypothetical protein